MSEFISQQVPVRRSEGETTPEHSQNFPPGFANGQGLNPTAFGDVQVARRQKRLIPTLSGRQFNRIQDVNDITIVALHGRGQLSSTKDLVNLMHREYAPVAILGKGGPQTRGAVQKNLTGGIHLGCKLI